MRLFFADLLMATGTVVVLLGSVGAGGAQTLRVIAVGVAIAAVGYLLDVRSRARALVLVGIVLGLYPGFGRLALAVILPAVFIARVRSRREVTDGA